MPPAEKPLLFVGSRAGGARNIAPVAKLAAESRPIAVLCSEHTQHVFAESGIPFKIYEDLSDSAAERLFDALDPASLICGTALYGDVPETALTRQAKMRGVRSVAVLDDWYRYAIRFFDPTTQVFDEPDFICCQDTMSVEDAVQEGLDRAKLVITGSPNLAAISALKESLATSPPPLPETMAGISGRPKILFLSETTALDWGTAHGTTGKIGAFIGYTEDTVRVDLVETLHDLGLPCLVVEKLHPKAVDGAAQPLSRANVEWVTAAGDSPLQPLIWHADIVIGMYSVTLLESALLGRRPASFQPGLIGPDRCTAVRLGVAEKLSDIAALRTWLKEQLAELPPREQQRTFDFANAEAAQNILHLALHGQR